MEKLSITTPALSNAETARTQLLAPYCRELTISIGYDEQARVTPVSERSRSSSGKWAIVKCIIHKESVRKHLNDAKMTRAEVEAMREAEDVKAAREQASQESKQQWKQLLAEFMVLQKLTIRVKSERGWYSAGHIEDSLAALRDAIEEARLPALQHLCFQPINCMGIQYFRSARSLRADGDLEVPSVWDRITRLDVQLYNPLSILNDSQKSVITHVLHDWLATFSMTLKSLRFIWLGDKGPSPLGLHRGEGLVCRPIQWHQLEEVWLGNIVNLDTSVRAMMEHAPNLTSTLTPRGGYLAYDDVFDNRNLWVKYITQNHQDDAEASRVATQMLLARALQHGSDEVVGPQSIPHHRVSESLPQSNEHGLKSVGANSVLQRILHHYERPVEPEDSASEPPPSWI